MDHCPKEEEKIFCYQCQETNRNTGCTTMGVCGKKTETAAIMDRLIRQLKVLAATSEAYREHGLFVAESLFMTVTNTNFDNERLQKQLDA